MFYTFSTKRYKVFALSSSKVKNQNYLVTTKDGNIAGAFMVYIDRNKYKSISVLKFDFGSNELKRNSVIKEVFKEYAIQMNMSLYIRVNDLDDSGIETIKSIGACTVVSIRTVWDENTETLVLRV